jgi:hypothetical protein
MSFVSRPSSLGLTSSATVGGLLPAEQPSSTSLAVFGVDKQFA